MMRKRFISWVVSILKDDFLGEISYIFFFENTYKYYFHFNSIIILIIILFVIFSKLILPYLKKKTYIFFILKIY